MEKDSLFFEIASKRIMQAGKIFLQNMKNNKEIYLISKENKL